MGTSLSKNKNISQKEEIIPEIILKQRVLIPVRMYNHFVDLNSPVAFDEKILVSFKDLLEIFADYSAKKGKNLNRTREKATTYQNLFEEMGIDISEIPSSCLMTSIIIPNGLFVVSGASVNNEHSADDDSKSVKDDSKSVKSVSTLAASSIAGSSRSSLSSSSSSYKKKVKVKEEKHEGESDGQFKVRKAISKILSPSRLETIINLKIKFAKEVNKQLPLKIIMALLSDGVDRLSQESTQDVVDSVLKSEKFTEADSKKYRQECIGDASDKRPSFSKGDEVKFLAHVSHAFDEKPMYFMPREVTSAEREFARSFEKKIALFVHDSSTKLLTPARKNAIDALRNISLETSSDELIERYNFLILLIDSISKSEKLENILVCDQKSVLHSIIEEVLLNDAPPSQSTASNHDKADFLEVCVFLLNEKASFIFPIPMGASKTESNEHKQKIQRVSSSFTKRLQELFKHGENLRKTIDLNALPLSTAPSNTVSLNLPPLASIMEENENDFTPDKRHDKKATSKLDDSFSADVSIKKKIDFDKADESFSNAKAMTGNVGGVFKSNSTSSFKENIAQQEASLVDSSSPEGEAAGKNALS